MAWGRLLVFADRVLRRVLGHDVPHPPHGHGAAQRSLAKPWTPNPDGPRSIADAIEFARTWGIEIEDDVKIVLGDAILRPDEDAAYGAFKSNKRYRWEDLLIGGRMTVKVRSNVLASDEGILDVLGHEMHEINALRRMFEERSEILGTELIELTEAGRPGNLHDEAWDVGGELVARLRAARRLAP